MKKQEPVNCSDSELCTFFQALEAGYLPTFYSDTNQFAPSKSMSIASKSYQRGRKTVSFHGFQSLTMCKHSMDDHGADSSMLLLVDSRAKTLASPGKVPESTENAAAYGVKWRASLAKYDHDSRSWKTAQRSLIEDSDECSVIWPRSGMTVNGECWELPMLVRRTKETGYGLWLYPTPTCNPEAPNHGSNSKGPHNLLDVAKQNWIPGMLWPTPKAHEPGMSAKTTGRDVTKSTHLTTQVALAEGMIDKQTGRLWRTPSASVVDAKSSVVKLTGRTPKDPQVGLADKVMAAERNMWPTPTVCGNNNYKGASATSGDGLATAVLKWPTPRARDHHPNGGTQGSTIDLPNVVKRRTYQTATATAYKGWSPNHNRADTNDRLDYTVERDGYTHGQTTPPMRLNPDWVEWLMGWPIGWTDLNPLGMDKCHCAQQQHGNF